MKNKIDKDRQEEYMGKVLIICDKEPAYAKCLMERIAKRRDLAFELNLCTAYETIAFLEKRQEVDILLIGDHIPFETRQKCKAKKVFVLTGDGDPELGEHEMPIYRYQAADQIISQILEGYADDIEAGIFRRFNRGKKRLIGIYSPVHRIGKTEFALALCRRLAEAEETLYLNLEEYSDLKELVPDANKTLADILYYIRQEKGNLNIHLGTAVKDVQGVSLIAPMPVSSDLKEVSDEEWQEFFALLLENSIYKTVVIDFGESIQGLFRLLELCDFIFTPIIEDPAALAKMSQYELTLKVLGYHGIAEKTLKFNMQQDKTDCVTKLLPHITKEEQDDIGRTVI